MRRTFTRLLLTIGSLGFAVSAHAATILDLTCAGCSDSANGVIYQQVASQSTGTGIIDPFLRVQANGTEQGYNTDLATQTAPFDDKGGTWTHDLQLSDLTVVTINGVSFYQFLLDINQTNANPLLSLNNVQIFTRSTAIATAPSSLSGLGTSVFNTDLVGGTGALNDVTVELNYNLNPGSGAGDMFMYVPTANFAGVLATDYVYFYTLFGNANGSNDGFEEWSLITNTPPTSIPDGGATAGMLGMAMLGLGLLARRKTASLI